MFSMTFNVMNMDSEIVFCSLDFRSYVESSKLTNGLSRYGVQFREYG